MKKEERKAVSKVAVFTAGVLLILFAVAGTQILSIFGITISSFMIAGGVLLFIVSMELLTHGAWRFGGTVSGESGAGTTCISFTCRPWSHYFCNNFLPSCWISCDNIVNCNCNRRNLYYLTIGKSHL